MNEDIEFVYAYFRRKGFNRELSLAMALHCCDPNSNPIPEKQ